MIKIRIRDILIYIGCMESINEIDGIKKDVVPKF
jgi:hypothetical protein